jgi:hypothetical protein
MKGFPRLPVLARLNNLRRLLKEFILSFRREAAGRWTCIAAAQIHLATGHIELAPGTHLVRGTRFMGIDLAEMLDRQYEQSSGNPQGSPRA